MFLYLYVEKDKAKLYPGQIINTKESADINIFAIYTKLTAIHVFSNRNNEYLIYKAQVIGELDIKTNNASNMLFIQNYILNPIKIITVLDQVKLEWTLLIEATKANHDKKVWHNISSNFALSDNFILRHKDKVDIEAIFHYQDLAVETIEELLLFDNNKDNNYWFYISCNQILNEDFIRKYKDKLYLYNVLLHSMDYLSDEFIKEIRGEI